MLLDKLQLTGRVALVTGGYGHLGRAMSEALAELGATVVVGARRQEKFAQAFPQSEPGKIVFQKLDISSAASIRQAFQKVAHDWGHIDVLVNNAIALPYDRQCVIGLDWHLGIDGILSSTFLCIREVIPYMKAQGQGSILNIGSMYGLLSPYFSLYEDTPGLSSPACYGAAKAGVIQLTKYFAVSLAPYHIKVNCISPGAFPSPEIQKQENFVGKLINKIPMRRLGNPDDLKGVVGFLASDASAYLTGQNIIVDGGWTLW